MDSRLEKFHVNGYQLDATMSPTIANSATRYTPATGRTSATMAPSTTITSASENGCAVVATAMAATTRVTKMHRPYASHHDVALWRRRASTVVADTDAVGPSMAQAHRLLYSSTAVTTH